MKMIDTDRIPAAAFDKMKEKRLNQAPPINNTELVNQFRAEGGNILHIRPDDFGSRGLTIAYKLKSSRVEIATAVQHRNDAFTKKVGTKVAIEHFLAGKTVTLPAYKDYFVSNMKSAMAYII